MENTTTNEKDLTKAVFDLSNAQMEMYVELEKIRTLLSEIYKKTDPEYNRTDTPENKTKTAMQIVPEIESLNNFASIGIDYTDKLMKMCDEQNNELDRIWKEELERNKAESLSN